MKGLLLTSQILTIAVMHYALSQYLKLRCSCGHMTPDGIDGSVSCSPILTNCILVRIISFPIGWASGVLSPGSVFWPSLDTEGSILIGRILDAGQAIAWATFVIFALHWLLNKIQRKRVLQSDE